MSHTANIQTLGGPIDVERAAEAHAERYGQSGEDTFRIHCQHQSFTVNANGADLPWEILVGVDAIHVVREYIGSIRGDGHTLQTAVYRFDCPTWGEEPDSVEEGA